MRGRGCIQTASSKSSLLQGPEWWQLLLQYLGKPGGAVLSFKLKSNPEPI